MSGWSAWSVSWRAALRIARREARTHRARSILIALMLALPTFGVAAADTVVNSSRLSTAEQLNRDLGASDALVQQPVSSAIVQTPGVAPDYFELQVIDSMTGDQKATAADQLTAGQSARILKQALPKATLLPETDASRTELQGPAGYAFLDYDQLAVNDKATTGLFDLTAGRMPADASQVVLTSAAAQQLGASVGSTVTLVARSAHDKKAAQFTVAGIVREPNSVNAAAAVTLPSAPSAVGASTIAGYVTNPGGVTWKQVEALNKGGYIVVSRDVVADPPPQSQVPYNSVAQRFQTAAPDVGSSSDRTAVTRAIGAIAVAMVLLEVVLLAGPAFAVGAKRRQREYALVGAIGADRRQLRRLVLAEGVVLGCLGALLGTGLGIGAAAAALPFTSHVSGKLCGALAISPLHVGGAAVLAVLLGLASALFPARAVSRQDILSTLTGRRAATGPRWRLPLAGLTAVAAGIGAVVYGTVYAVHGAETVHLQVVELVPGKTATVPEVSGYGYGPVIIVAGIALLEIGMIICTPMLLRLAALAGRILPLGPRLALRDGARHRGRTTPAVAAMFAAVAGAVVAGVWFASSAAQQRELYQPTLRDDQVAVHVDGPAQAASFAAQLDKLLPAADHFTVQSVNDLNSGDADDKAQSWALALLSPGQKCSDVATFYAVGSQKPTEAESCALAGDVFPLDDEGIVVGGPALFQAVTGVTDPAAAAVVREGGIVVFEPGVVVGGRAQLDSVPVPVEVGPKATQVRQVQVPAVYEDPVGAPDPGVWISPQAAKQLGLPSQGRQTLVFDLRSHVTANQEAQADQYLATAGLDSGLLAENGYQGREGLADLVVLLLAALLTVGAAAIATGLAITDARPDLETLDAVGAAPVTRRVLAACTVLVITGLGALIGVPVGFAVAGVMLKVANASTIGSNAEINASGSGFGARFALLHGALMPFSVPWSVIGLAVLAVPAATMAGAALLTRSRPLSRRRMP